MSSMRYERCPKCGGVLASQMEDLEIKRYDEDHAHVDGAPSASGRPVLPAQRSRKRDGGTS